MTVASGRGLLLGMYSEAGDLAIEGDALGLHFLARALERDQASIQLAAGRTGADPYDGFLRVVSLDTDQGKVRVAREGSTLRVVGSQQFKALLAANVMGLADAPARESDHLHIDYYPSHPYLDAGSASLVLGRIPEPPSAGS